MKSHTQSCKSSATAAKAAHVDERRRRNGYGKNKNNDYGEDGIDTIMVLGATKKDVALSDISGNDIISSVGTEGQIVVKGGANKYTEVVNAKGTRLAYRR